jgi:hypothetical protein
VRDRVNHQAFGIDWYTDDADAERSEQKNRRRIARIFNGDPIAGRKQDAGQQIESLLRAGGDDDIVGGCLDAT